MHRSLSKMFSIITILALMVVALPVPSAGAIGGGSGSISLTTLGTVYTQDFDTLANTGTTNNLTINGWFLEEGNVTATANNGLYAAGTGSGNGGDIYSFGAAASSERAFGGLLSGSVTPTIGASFTNNTGQVVTALDVSYIGEMWRAGVLNRNAADRLDFQLSTNATSLTNGTWVDYDSLDYNSSNINTTSGAVNGNAAGNQTVVSLSITGLSLPNGSSFWIRWADFNIASSDDGLAVDTFSLTPRIVDFAPEVDGTFPVNGATDFPINANLTVSFSEPVNVSASWFTLTCSVSGPSGVPTTFSGGPSDFTIDPGISLADGETCTLTIVADQVTDVDGNDPPDDMVMDFEVGFSAYNFCAQTYTPIYQIQGSGASVALTGTQTTQGVVVGDYEGAAPALRGFFIQDLAGDGNPATSDGIFVFEGSNASTVSLGDVVRVTGTAGENQGQSQISVGTIINCGTGSVAPTDVTFPVASSVFLEQYEGMLVRLPQTMYVTEHFQLGRFGQVVISADGRLQQPTNVVAPGDPAVALQAENNLRKIILDDASQAQNPDPILFGRGGLPLSASNTLRGGDTATGIVGVLNYTWAGNAASGNAYRIRPINALSGYVNFEATNPRPASAPEVGGSIKVTGMNLLNFFNTFADNNTATPGCFPGGGDSDCRGANSSTEFTRQSQKTVAAILAMNPDVLGVNEIENDGYGSASALQSLVDQLNAATALGTYSFIDVDANTGQTNAMGTDAIKVGLLYKPASVTPVGQTAVLNSVAFVNGGDSAPRSRPSLAQAFEVNSTGARFIVDVNHLKSKGSACTAPDAGDGQGNCNAVRVNAATELMNWLATDPTGTGDSDVLLVGDYNSYAMEDPITVIKNAGFTNLIESFLGPDAYSYVFDGQWGYLDHALGSASIVSQVTGVGDYHINSDEPSVLDYNVDFKTANLISTLYAPDQFRVSDHDPVIVGLDLNAPPVATPDSAMVAKNSSVAIFALANDFDYDGDTLTVVEYSQGSHGTVKYSTKNNNFRYTPTKGFRGTDSFTYTISDGQGHTATTTVTITVQ